MMKSKVILYVDDDADDREFLSEAIKDADPQVEVICAENGLQALEYLQDVKESNSGVPCLIVLDINMPFLDGKETFSEIKKDPAFETVPVLIFSSSERPNDKILFNNLGVEFISKPTNLVFMNSIANRMVNFCC